MQHVKWGAYDARTSLSPLLVYGGSQSWVGGGSGYGVHWALLRQNIPCLVDGVLDADEDGDDARVPRSVETVSFIVCMLLVEGR